MAIADQDSSLEPWAPRWPPPCPESSGSVPGAPAPAPALLLQNWAVHKRHLGLGQCGTLKLMDRQRLGLSKLWAGKCWLGGGKRDTVGRIFVFFIINSLSFLVLFKFSYILFYFSLFNCILYSVVNSDYLSDKLKKAIKKQEPMSDFPVHVIYIVSDRYIYIHILDILFRLHYSDPLMPQEVSDTLKHS